MNGAPAKASSGTESRMIPTGLRHMGPQAVERAARTDGARSVVARNRFGVEVARVSPVASLVAAPFAWFGPRGLVALHIGLGAALALLVVLVSVLLALKLGKGGSKPFLDPQPFQPLTLTRVDQLAHNTKRFVFPLPHPAMRLGLPTG